MIQRSVYLTQLVCIEA